MKAIMIIYNQAHTERVEYLMEKLGIKGYSLWENVQGQRKQIQGFPIWEPMPGPRSIRVFLQLLRMILSIQFLKRLRRSTQ